MNRMKGVKRVGRTVRFLAGKIHRKATRYVENMKKYPACFNRGCAGPEKGRTLSCEDV